MSPKSRISRRALVWMGIILAVLALVAVVAVSYWGELSAYVLVWQYDVTGPHADGVIIQRELISLGEKALPALTDGLRSTNADKARFCAETLGKLGPKAGRALPVLLDSGAPGSFEAAEEIVCPRDVPYLLARIESGWHKQPGAVMLAHAGGPEAMEYLKNVLLSEPDSVIRGNVIAALADSTDPGSAGPLLAAAERLCEADSKAKTFDAFFVAGALVCKGDQGIAAVKKIVQEAKLPRVRAAFLLGLALHARVTGQHRSWCLARAVEWLECSEDELRIAALRTFLQCRTCPQPTRVVKLLQDPNPDISRSAGRALSVCPSPATRKALEDALRSTTDREFRTKLRRCLDKLLERQRAGKPVSEERGGRDRAQGA